MKLPSKVSGSSPQVMQTLAWCRRLDFRPVPLLPRSKAATSRSFAEPSYSPPPDSHWSSHDFGIGVVLGPRANGPVDVDLDCNEAIFFAPRFLPSTPAVFGRISKKSSHYLYRVGSSGLPKKAYLDPLREPDDDFGATIIELRADGGHQTVLPGSIHQDTGELIEWSSVPFPDVPTVEEAVLVKGVQKIALATLIARHLWHEGQRNEILKSLSGMFFYLDWTEDEAADIVEAVMDWTDDDDKTRRMTLAATYKKGDRGTKITGAATLRRLTGSDVLVDRMLELAGSPTVNLLSEYNERFAVVSVEGRFRIADLDVPTSEQPIFMLKDDFLNLMGTDYVTLDDKPVPKAKLWLANARRRAYRSVDFIPGVEDSSRFLNLWTGWAVQPASGKCDAWLELLRTVICGNDPDLFNWMLHWFANIVREPRSKPLTAPVLIGKEGAGKSLLLLYFGRILGSAYTTITNEEHIYGKFNRHLATTLLLHSEEALYGGEKKHKGIIKSLITDEFRMFEQKGIDARQVRNYLRLVLTSNEAHAAPASAGDRRYTVIDMEDRMASKELIRKVLDEMKDKGPEALFNHLITMEYDPAIPRVNVKNEALGTLQGVNASPLESWWVEALQAGQILPDWLAWASKSTQGEDPAWPRVVSSSALYLAMSLKLRDRGVRQIPNETLFALHLTKFIGIKLTKAQKWYSNPQSEDAPMGARQLSDRQNSITNMPDLDYCRGAFCTYMGQQIEWASDAADEERPAYDKY